MNSTFSRFCIHRAESPIVAASGCPSTSFSPAPSAAVSRFRASKILRLGLIIHANYLQEIPTFDETGSFTQFLEQGSTSRTYTGGSGTAFEIGGMYALLPRFSIGWSFEFLETMQDGTLDVSVPHPLLFNKSRDAAEPAVTSLSGCYRRESHEERTHEQSFPDNRCLRWHRAEHVNNFETLASCI